MGDRAALSRAAGCLDRLLPAQLPRAPDRLRPARHPHPLRPRPARLSRKARALDVSFGNGPHAAPAQPGLAPKYLSIRLRSAGLSPACERGIPKTHIVTRSCHDMIVRMAAAITL